MTEGFIAILCQLDGGDLTAAIGEGEGIDAEPGGDVDHITAVTDQICMICRNTLMGGLFGGKMRREDKFNMLKIARKLLRTLPTTLDLLNGKRHREVILLRCRLQIKRRRIG